MLKKGYKQTELGMIPEDWEVKRLGDICFLVNEKTNSFDRKNYISTENMVSYRGGITEATSIPIGINVTHYSFYDVLVSNIRPYLKKIWYATKEGGCSNDISVFRPFQEVNNLFLYHILSQDKFFEYANSNVTGTKMPRLNKKTILYFDIVFPTNQAEQTAIASVLSDMDEYILSLERLIAKKKAIKQGAMQQLLNPFMHADNTDETDNPDNHRLNLRQSEKSALSAYKKTAWVVKKLGEVCSILRGGSPRPIQFYLTGSEDGINWIKIGDVDVEAKYITETKEKIISSGVSMSRRVFIGDFILSNSMSFGRPYILKIDGCIHDGWLVIQNYEESFDTNYLYYLLCSENIFKQYVAMAAGSSVQNLTKEKVANLEVIIPSFPEQTAIATILSDMDAEIEALQAKLSKAQLIKHGAMQQLLTGQIRLVNTSLQSQLISENKVIPISPHIVGGHIVKKLYGSKGWGRTKLQKSMHLLDYCCQLDFGYEYIRNIAGPDSQPLMNHIDAKFKQFGHVRIEIKKDDRGGKHYSYIPTSLIDEIEQVYNSYPVEKQGEINNLLDKIKKMDLARAEIVSTLYAVWNNRIIKRQLVKDDLLLSDFYDWSEHKSDFSKDLVLRGLNYMRKEGVIPIGWVKYIYKK